MDIATSIIPQDCQNLSRQELQTIFKTLGIKGANARNADLIEILEKHKQAMQQNQPDEIIALSAESNTLKTSTDEEVVEQLAMDTILDSNAPVIEELIVENTSEQVFTVTQIQLQGMVSEMVKVSLAKEMPSIITTLKSELNMSQKCSSIKSKGQATTFNRMIGTNAATTVEARPLAEIKSKTESRVKAFLKTAPFRPVLASERKLQQASRIPLTK